MGDWPSSTSLAPKPLFGMNTLFPALALVCLASVSPAAAAACKDPVVCKQWYNDIFNTIDYSWSNEKVEAQIDKHCKKIGEQKPFSKMCYYTQGVKRKISKDMLQGAPAELACKRYTAQDHEVECPNCLEKSDMIKRIRETILKPDKKEL